VVSGKNELRSISSEEWGDIYKRLRFYTWKRYKWLHDRMGVDLDDFVHEAISDTLQGKRRWPPTDEQGRPKDVSLFFFLCQVVRSKVYHFWNRESRNVSVNLTDQDQTSDQFPESFETLLAESAEIHPAFGETKGTDSDAIDNEFKNRLRELVAGDVELMKIVEHIIDDPRSNPREIAASLGLDIKRVYAAQKRLRRRLVLQRT